MNQFLITGATGNVGMEILKSLIRLDQESKIIIGVKDVLKTNLTSEMSRINLVRFDFIDTKTFMEALTGCDVLFLIRPPQLSEVEKIFTPLIEMAIKCRVKHIVFLSVQGVENSNLIPHHKIEKLIVQSKLAYTFLRPAYFMQNFTTTLRTDLVDKKRIFLPAGNSKFNLIDVTDIGEVAARILIEPYKHINQTYELTCNERLTFTQMAAELSNVLNTTIQYESPTLLKFFFVKRTEAMPTMLILVMMLLHYLPRFQKEPLMSDCVKQITGHQPNTFGQFIIENRNLLR